MPWAPYDHLIRGPQRELALARLVIHRQTSVRAPRTITFSLKLYYF